MERTRTDYFRLTLIVLAVIASIGTACFYLTSAVGLAAVANAWAADLDGNYEGFKVIAPFTVSTPPIETVREKPGGGQLVERREYYVWILGWVAKLPYSSESVRDLPPSASTKHESVDNNLLASTLGTDETPQAINRVVSGR